MNGSAAEQAVVLTREDWGRIIALLAARDGDLAGAEDAVADAAERALRSWPSSGIPRNPSGWIYRAALNVRRDVWKSAAFRTAVDLDADARDAAEAGCFDTDLSELPDRRLQLLAACAHPDIDPASRPLLMLSAVLGLPTRRIAEGMVLPAATVAARLTRAKKRVKADGLTMRIPDRGELPRHLPSIREAIYGVFTIEWANASPDVREGLTGEALHLAELVAGLCPDDGESHGLAALLHLSAARFDARRDAAGALVPLSAQDPDAWDRHHVAEGHRHLREARRCGVIGRYAIEAAVQALHMHGARTGAPDWDALLRQHDHLLRIAPSLGGSVSRAAILHHSGNPAAALEALDHLPPQAAGYQPVWVVRSHLYRDLDRGPEAISALERAIALTTVTSEREHLQQTLARWSQRP